AREDEDGYLTIVDRKKDMIVTGGFNVFPREVEDVISSHPAVANVAVIGVPDDRWGEAGKAVVVRRPGASAEAEELIARGQAAKQAGRARYRPRTDRHGHGTGRGPGGARAPLGSLDAGSPPA